MEKKSSARWFLSLNAAILARRAPEEVEDGARQRDAFAAGLAVGPMFATRRYYLDGRKYDFGRIVRRLFGHELTVKEVDKLTRYGDFVSRRARAFAEQKGHG